VRVGIVGGGQLGMMLVEAGDGLGIDCVTLDPIADSPASRVGPTIVGAYDDPAALARLADGVDVLTYEFENVPVDGVRALEGRVAVLPPTAALGAAQDRLAEKMLFTEIGLPVATFAAVDDLESLGTAIDAIGLPAVLKSRRFGYDGKGQAVLRHEELAEDAWRAVGEVPSILEAFVGFDRELSVLAVRGRDGETRCWPLVENHHRDGILRLSWAPAPALTAGLQAAAEAHAVAMLEHLAYVGVLAIELFQVEDSLLGNEMAPRVHNSGHWTIEGSTTSQFENHLRAICGMPLGDVGMRGYAAMVNLIGEEPSPGPILEVPGAHLHTYGKEPRPGRKLGHVTVTADDEGLLRERVANISGSVPDYQTWPT
jgi:5-(carboxyamino)imidazole ribonucleotide synthase